MLHDIRTPSRLHFSGRHKVAQAGRKICRKAAREYTGPFFYTENGAKGGARVAQGATQMWGEPDATPPTPTPRH